MKKIYLMLALVAGVLTSCDMDKEPYGVLPDKGTFQAPSNFVEARAGLYVSLKGCVGGETNYVAPELQCENFNAVSGFSNTLSTMYRWEFTTDDGVFSGMYGSAQGTITCCNFIIDGYNSTDFSNTSLWNPNPQPDPGEDKTNLGLLAAKKAKGDAFFTRAYALFMLAQYFCDAYDPATADQPNTGASYSLSYAPTVTPDKYPGRNTLKQTYQQIYDDLDSASVYVTATPQANNPYISVDAITALRARVALAQGNYELARDEAALLIESGTYTLCSSPSDLTAMYTYDGVNLGMGDATGSSEAIFQLISASTNELPSATGTRFLPYQDGAVPDYIPTRNFVELFANNDYRRSVYFEQKYVMTTAGAGGTVYVFNKYPDHGFLYQYTGGSEASRFNHMPTVFRIAEMYLIAAEASTMMGDLDEGQRYLEELQENRFESYEAPDLSTKEKLMTEIQNERTRELACEGFHLIDLKRWHKGFSRGIPQQRDLCSLPGASTTDMVVAADDPRLTWPIPKHEMNVNKQIVQNKGYTK